MTPPRAALPWLLAAGLLAFVFWRVDLAAVGAALAAAHWGVYLAVAAGFTLIWLGLDSLVLARLVSRFHRPLSVRQLLPLRGASYLLMAISYDAAQAGLGLALHRRFGIPLLAIGGTYLFYYLIDLGAIGLLGSAGARAVPGAMGRALALALGALLGGALLALALLARWSRSPSERVPQALRGSALLATLRRARLRDVAEFLAWRATFYLSFVVFAACSLPAFGIRVPLRALAALVPVVMSVSALPVTVAGLGSTQLAMWTLYRPYAEPAAILAYSVVYSATLVLLRLPIALVCLPAASDVLARRESPGAAARRGRSLRMRSKLRVLALLVLPAFGSACFTVNHRYAGEKILTNGSGLEQPTRVVRHFEAHDRQFFWLHGGVPTGEPLNALALAAEQAGPHPGVVNLVVKDGQDLADILITHVPCLLSMLCGSWSAWAEGDVVDYSGAASSSLRRSPASPGATR